MSKNITPSPKKNGFVSLGVIGIIILILFALLAWVYYRDFVQNIPLPTIQLLGQ